MAGHKPHARLDQKTMAMLTQEASKAAMASRSGKTTLLSESPSAYSDTRVAVSACAETGGQARDGWQGDDPALEDETEREDPWCAACRARRRLA